MIKYSSLRSKIGKFIIQNLQRWCPIPIRLRTTASESLQIRKHSAITANLSWQAESEGEGSEVGF